MTRFLGLEDCANLGKNKLGTALTWGKTRRDPIMSAVITVFLILNTVLEKEKEISDKEISPLFSLFCSTIVFYRTKHTLSD